MLYNTNLNFDEVASRFYNTPKVSFISKNQSKRFTNYTIAYACNCCQTYYRELNNLADHMIQEHIPKEHPDNTASFESLNDEKKWKLSTGTIVEDVLYNFKKLFTIQEIDEMKKETPMNVTSRIPQDLVDYINHFNCDNLKDLRTRLADTQDWEKEELYESGELNTAQKEQWYNKHVWLPIDTVFDDINSIHIVAGESRIRSGYKCDMIVRERKANHEEANEFGAGETGVKSSGTKHIEEGGIKLPKVLKDMLDNLVFNNNGSYESLATFGLRQSGLNITLIITDKPKAYITRITRLKQLSFPSEVRLFGKQVLPLLVLMWQFKQQILKIQQHISCNQDNNLSNSDWLQ
ncbi:hypothetical protein RO3G_13492 [Rhizopus delemar RA 99-880]|uniref:C2H2-type domain-containing protein n=1 Tax=Rhizopus delemar (strain RA 99-880 / ATCC MYA-4621 / FGSC 9543 / NRRL 43880) TaxID=246409 RepID=I1CK01_RHIO9|nr:hypothetical protein RO3G_13492 [Rhizopus delemar RA 99-880]|eukprot:EIE88781.1 hypothetical protein RO3G_13492 [Rhizopus delemar RA 99-880]